MTPPTRGVLRVLSAVAQTHDPARIAAAVEGLLLDLGAEYARCWFHDAERGVLWSADGDEVGVAQGLAGRAARTGEPQSTDRIERDPRSDPRADGALPGPRLALPVARHAVLVVGPALAPEALEPFVLHLAPLLELAAQWASLDVDDGDRGPFRREAIEAYGRSADRGALLDLDSAALDRGYRALFTLGVLGALAAAWGTW